MNDISKDKLRAQTAKVVPRWFLDWPALPNYLLRSLIRDCHPYSNSLHMSSLLLKFVIV